MTVYMTRGFHRFARKADLTDARLLAAARDVQNGRFDADLGGGVFKQRVARVGGGKSGGFRTIILFRRGGHGFFAHGFAKNDKANVSIRELSALRQLGLLLSEYGETELIAARSAGELIEVTGDDDDKRQG